MKAVRMKAVRMKVDRMKVDRMKVVRTKAARKKACQMMVGRMRVAARLVQKAFQTHFPGSVSMVVQMRVVGLGREFAQTQAQRRLRRMAVQMQALVKAVRMVLTVC